MMTLSCGVLAREEQKRVCSVGRYVSVFCISLRHEHLCPQTLYQRRKRDANCIVGKEAKAVHEFVHNCACSPDDFEW